MSRDRFSPTLNLKTLPITLQKELINHQKQNYKILNIFEEGGGTLNVSEVLVGLYKMHKMEKTRTQIIQILHQMENKGLLVKTGKRGEYTVTKKNS